MNTPAERVMTPQGPGTVVDSMSSGAYVNVALDAWAATTGARWFKRTEVAPC